MSSNASPYWNVPTETLSDEVLREVAAKYWRLPPERISPDYIAKLRNDSVDWDMITAPAPTRE